MKNTRQLIAKRLIDIVAEYQRAEAEFGDEMVKLGFGNYTENSYDLYDSSIEFLDVGISDRLNNQQLDYIFSEGFSLVFLNHKDNMETIYSHENKDGERKWKTL